MVRHPNDAAVGWWRGLAPGQTLEVEYEGDDTAHERIALWPVTKDVWMVLSPDGDVWDEDLSGSDPSTGPRRSAPFKSDGRRYSAQMPLYRFRKYPTDDQLVRYMRGAVAAARSEGGPGLSGIRPLLVKNAEWELVPLDTFCPSMGVLMQRRRLRSKTSVKDDEEEEEEEEEEADKGSRAPKQDGIAGGEEEKPADEKEEDTLPYVWLMPEPYGDKKVGQEVDVSEYAQISLGKDRRALYMQGRWIVADRVRTVAAAGYAEVRCASFSPVVIQNARVEGVPSSRSNVEAALAGESTRDAADVRTLWVDWDSHGERWKPWREAVRESTAESFPDAPLEGANTSLHMCKSMERMGGCPRLRLDRWAREKRLEPTDRAVHEMRVLTEALRLFGTYGQVNLGALAGIETICRRIAFIVDAYANPAKPSWDNAKFLVCRAPTRSWLRRCEVTCCAGPRMRSRC